jgi:hypothetical protein
MPPIPWPPVRKLWAGSPQQKAFRAALVAILVLGLALRALGYLGHPIAFWLDEAFWANRLLKKDLLQLVIRPVGYMWLTKQLVHAFGPTEFWFRFPSELGSAAALLLAPYVASQLFSSRAAQLLLVFLFAVHPALIDLAKEFKPYSFEVLVHMIPLVLFLRYRETKRRRHWVALLLVLPLLLPFAYNMIFAYPGLLLLMLWKGWSQKSRGMVIGALASGALCAGALGTIYELTLHRVKVERSEAYWGNKYDVFYVQSKQPSDALARVSWLAEKYGDMAALPGLGRLRWDLPKPLEKWGDELRDLDRLLWIGLHLLGLFYLVSRRRREELLLLYMPLLALIAVNIAGRWPLGAFRTNLFLCVYLLPIPIYGLAVLAGSTVRRRATVGALAAAVAVLPALLWGLGRYDQKLIWTRGHQMPAVLELLQRQRDEHLAKDPGYPRETLILDAHTSHSNYYYLHIHPSSRERNESYFRANFRTENEPGDVNRMVRRIRRRLRASREPIWVVVSKKVFMEPVLAEARRRGRVLFERRIGDDHLILRIAPK